MAAELADDGSYLTDLERIAAWVASSYPLRRVISDHTCRCFYCGTETLMEPGQQPPRPDRFLHRAECVWTLAKELQ